MPRDVTAEAQLVHFTHRDIGRDTATHHPVQPAEQERALLAEAAMHQNRPPPRVVSQFQEREHLLGARRVAMVTWQRDELDAPLAANIGFGRLPGVGVVAPPRAAKTNDRFQFMTLNEFSQFFGAGLAAAI